MLTDKQSGVLRGMLAGLAITIVALALAMHGVLTPLMPGADSSLDFARDCGYVSDAQHEELVAMNREVGRMLGSMLKNPSPFLTPDP